jgi:hypothetical protein
VRRVVDAQVVIEDIIAPEVDIMPGSSGEVPVVYACL